MQLVSPATRLPTPLTEANRRAGRPEDQRKTHRLPRVSLPAACQACGVVLNDPDRQYCHECYPERREEAVNQWVEGKLERLARMRAGGVDPGHSVEADRKRAETILSQQAAAKVWEQAEEVAGNDLDFAQDVLPRLQGVSLDRMARATGLSRSYCSFVRRGLKVPHRRHWSPLKTLVDMTQSATSSPTADKR
jgi:hypothetical protein